MPEAPDPGGRRARARPAGARRARCRRPAAPSRARSTCSTSPDAIVKKFKRAVDRLGHARSSARADKPGHHEPDRDPRRRARRRARARSSASSPARGYGDFKAAVGEEVADWLAPVRERYEELRADEAALEDAPRGGRREGARDRRRRRVADVREAMGVGPPPVRRPRRLAFRGRWRTVAHRLELDLDVFAGPFDLLLSLILREELDLLEVELAEIVARLPRPPRGARRARPRGRDRVPGPDRRAAGAQVAADAARRGGRGARRAGARRGGRGAARADARSTRASAAPAATWRARHEAEQAVLYRSAPLPPELRRAPLEHAEQAYDPAVLGAGARRPAAHAAADRPRATWRRRASRVGERLARAARPAAARRASPSTRRSRAPTG